MDSIITISQKRKLRLEEVTLLVLYQAQHLEPRVILFKINLSSFLIEI